MSRGTRSITVGIQVHRFKVEEQDVIKLGEFLSRWKSLTLDQDYTDLLSSSPNYFLCSWAWLLHLQWTLPKFAGWQWKLLSLTMDNIICLNFQLMQCSWALKQILEEVSIKRRIWKSWSKGQKIQPFAPTPNIYINICRHFHEIMGHGLRDEILDPWVKS